MQTPTNIPSTGVITAPSYSFPGGVSIGNITNGTGITGAGGLASNSFTISGSSISSGQASTKFGSFSAPVTKASVAYIVVQTSGACLELSEQQSMTPREMIGICKFLLAATHAENFGFGVQWTDLIDSLGIRRHFKNGAANHAAYPIDTPTFYIKLFDEV